MNAKPKHVDQSRTNPGRTQQSDTGKGSPRLPHEHDESSDSSGQKPQASIQQAYADVKRGLVDTDKGPPMDRAYQKQKGPNAA